MTKHTLLRAVAIAALIFGVRGARADDGIPKAAWRRPLGLPLQNPGVKRNPGDIDDGYWQGAPVGGFGSGTFSRTYRGDFARWHIKAGVHKYEPVYANQFAMFQQSEGDATGMAQVLMNDHPQGRRAFELATGTIRLVRGSMRRSIRNPGTTTNGRNFQRTWFSSSIRPCFPTITANQVIRSPSIAGTPKIPRTKLSRFR